ncbi:hypothetical protein [Leptospira sp. GIMC2001]|uniref:hypothetical protein n=1 Tax=Leptospira sp. GIMC2001 TaxID=1513297 RepID=UPI00234B2E6E|nr:hypothetical protein [Leptospira sp. GIMC2001]WCL48468.1 hypothetical protein O4O04_14305 [Leptospira sp. GIMC2001]
MNTRILYFLYIGFFTVNLVSCQIGKPSTTTPYQEHSTLANTPKLGVVILQKVQKEKLPHYLLLEIAEMISNSQLNLQMSDWMPNQNIEWIPTYVDGSFDDTQDYLSNTKKNILEIHTNLKYKSGLGSEVFHILTFSLFPRVFDYNLQMKSYFYDSDGIRHELITTESLTIVDKQGKLVDHDAVDNNAEQQIYASLAELIQKSHAMILEKKYSFTDFEPIEQGNISNPFLFSIDYISCKDNYSIEYGVGVRSTAIFDNKKYNFCTTEIRFLNKSERSYSIYSKDFSIISNGQSIKSLETVPGYSVQLLANGKFLRRHANFGLANSIVLKTESDQSLGVLELYFLFPKDFDRSDVRIRWTNPQNPDENVESWIGDLELK